MDAFGLGAGISGKQVVVTGAASGIGGAVAEMVAAVGGLVVAIDLPGTRLDHRVAGLAGTGHRALPIDLARADAIEPAIRAAVDGDRIWGLVHAAAYLRRRDPAEVTVSDWDAQVDVNLKATFFLNRVVGDLLVAAGRGGRIVNFTSAAWMMGPLNGSDVYVATKGGVVSLAKGFVRRLGPSGITVNVISPGQIDTDMQRRDNSPEMMEAAIAACPLRRMGRPEEVAGVALFLLSEHAGFVSGATLNVSGGTLLY